MEYQSEWNLAPIIRGVQKSISAIELELYEQGSKKVEISVQEGLIDIGIICTKPNPKELVLLPYSDPTFRYHSKIHAL